MDTENVKVKVTEICKGVVPDLAEKMSEVVDVAHRLGKPVSGRASVGSGFAFFSTKNAKVT